MKTDILITNGIVVPEPGKNEIIRSGFVAIRENLIIKTGQMSEIDTIQAEKTINAENMLIMPGLVNTHCHSAMTLFRGLADDLELSVWLNEHIFPAEAKYVNPDMVYWCSKLAAAEMILSGTTFVADGYFQEHEAAKAFHDSGLRAVAAHGVVDFPAPGVADPEKNIKTVAGFITEWKGKDPLITPAVFAHSAYTCSPATLKKAKALATENGLPFFIHLAETKYEHKMIIDPKADSPTKHLEKLGLLDEQTVCVHCVWLDEDDIDILAKHNARAVVCTQSNMKLASGTVPLVRMLKKGIMVGLGTDSCASNNSLDMFREMDICAKLQKVSDLDPVAVPASDILKAATENGAALLGYPGRLGKITPGYLADLIMIDLNTPHLRPFHHPETLVYSPAGAAVDTSIINGKIVMQGRKLLLMDLDETMDKVKKIAADLRQTDQNKNAQ